MSKDIVSIIRRVLLESGEVSIAGLGTFQLKRSPAKFILASQMIQPSCYSLSIITDDTEHSERLIHYISRYYDLTSSEANAMLVKWTDTITKRLQDDEKVALSGIGTISGEALVFESANVLEEWYTKGLLPVKPIFNSYAVTNDTNEEHLTSEDKDYSLKIIPFVLLLCLLTFALKYFSENPYQKAPQSPVNKEKEIIDKTYTDSSRTSSEKDSKITLVQRDTCIVITGYFVKARHVLRMVDRIEALGYESYIEDVADGNRVGLIFDCTDLDLRENIYEIRKKISKDAWYLEPPITIE